METGQAIIGAVTIPLIVAFIEFIIKPILPPEKGSKFYPMIGIVFAVLFNVIGTGLTTGWIGAALWTSAIVGLTTGIAAGYGYDKVIAPFKSG